MILRKHVGRITAIGGRLFALAGPALAGLAVGGLGLGIVGQSAHAAPPAAAPTPAEIEFFEAKVRPILVRRCQECHGRDKQESGLRLDRPAGWLQGGDRGPAVRGGQPDASLLVQAVRHDKLPGGDELKMPPRGKLPEAEIAILVDWVARGAAAPVASPGTATESGSWDAVFAERSRWWSLQPVRPVAVPDAQDDAWSAHAVDRFIRARLAAHGLEPAPPADDTTLARRLSLVVTGLPPNPNDVAACRRTDGTLDVPAYVERLLASPHFGERWARHWMDVVRYSDTHGYEWDIPAKGAWRYRDYLIRAFNADIAFDQLLREQIAGDLLESPRLNPIDQINESAIGPMFYQLGEKRHGDSAMFDGIHQEMLHNKIDAFGRSLQALTIGCAQCHDHKLDAVSQRDYYALAGLLFSPRWSTRTIDLPDRDRFTRDALRARKADIRRALAERWSAAAREFGQRLAAAQAAAADAPDPWRQAQAVPAKMELPLEHPLHAWARLVKSAAAGEDLAKTWDELAAKYRQARSDRQAANRGDYRVVADFTAGLSPGWSTDGVGLADGASPAGELMLAVQGDRAVSRVFPAGLFTSRLSTRLNGLVRSPLVTSFPEPKLSVLVVGGDFAAERLVVDNAFLAERQTALGGEFTWKTFPTFAGDPGRPQVRSFVEFATKTSNSNFPPRPGLGGMDPSREQIADPRSWFGVIRAVAHSVATPPADELERFERLFVAGTAAPQSLDEGAQRVGLWLAASVQRWSTGTADDEDARLLDWLVRQQLLPNQAGDPAWSALLAEYRTIEQRVQEPWTVNSLVDLDEPADYRLNIRGQYDRPADPVPRGYMTVLAASAQAAAIGGPHGRRPLADRVASAANPLTARVYVNRVWHWVFGAGIVATTDDFGHLGETPSHPELLDFLARWFVDHDWSTKDLMRLLLTSSTFQQSSRTTPRALEVDPTNRLLHHFALRRLEAEAIRDELLAVSGRLDYRLYGPTLDPPRAKEDPQKRLFSGPLDGGGRRSIYTKACIMEPARFLATFNQPPPKIPTGRRDVTNVPAQALALLNDPLVIEQAGFWAARELAQEHDSVRDRLERMFAAALGRPPRTEELDRWQALVDDLAREHAVPTSADVLGSHAVWRDVAHALFNTKEFIYYR